MLWRTGILVLLFSTLTLQNGLPYVIDNFDEPMAPITAPPLAMSTTNAVTGVIIGGVRNATVTVGNGPGMVTMQASGGSLTLMGTMSTFGIGTLEYDGGVGNLGVDMSQNADSVLIRLNSAAVASGIDVSFQSNLGMSALVHSFNIPSAINAPVDLVTPLTGASTLYTDINNIFVRMFDMSIDMDYLCIVAGVDGVFTANVPAVTVGQTIQYTYVVQNPVSMPGAPFSTMRIEVQIPSGLATLDEASITTTQGTINPTGSNTVNIEPGVIANGASVTVQFNVVAVAVGELSMHAVTVSDNGRRLNSHPVARVGSLDRCCAPEPTNVTIFPAPPVSGSGDPHFIGFLGQRFDFHGTAGNIYNLISDRSFQLNSLFGDADLRKGKTKTYMTKLGIVMCGTLVYFECDRENGRHVVQLNGKDMKPGDHFKVKHVVNIKRVDLANSKTTVKTENYKMTVRFSRSNHSSCHLNFKLSYDHTPGTAFPHGIVGQTAQGTPGDVGVGANSPNIVEGEEANYIVANNDIFGTDFSFNKYDWHACFENAQVGIAKAPVRYDSFGS